MPRITLNRAIRHQGADFEAGETVTVTDTLARSWLLDGLASEAAPEVEESTDLNELKKDELIALAEERGLDSSGTKAEILDRLNE